MIIIPKLIMNFQKIAYGKRCQFYGLTIMIKSPKGKISIGDGVRIRSSFFSNFIGLYQRSILITKDNGEISIGNRTGMSGVTVYARNKITIGQGCLIGANTKILDNDFHPIDPEIRRVTPGSNIPSKPINIGDNVFVGCNTLILKGVSIGDNSTIGAGSVVTGSIPSNCVAAGNPARVIRYLGAENEKISVDR